MMKKTTLLFISFVGCVQHPVLVVPGGSQAVRGRVDGTEVLAASHLWDGGPSDFEAYLTPIAIDIHNNGDTPVSFRFEDVVLTDDEGNQSNPLVVNLPRSYTSRAPGAVPEKEQGVPDKLHDSVEHLVGNDKSDKPSAVFMDDRARIRPSRPLFSWDWSAYREWKLGLRGIELPRIYSQRAMLPAEIPAGAERHGFLYFPRLPEGAKHMVLLWNLQRDEGVAKVVKLPFLVQR